MKTAKMTDSGTVVLIEKEEDHGPKLLPIPLVIFCKGDYGITKRTVSHEIWGPALGYKLSDFLNVSEADHQWKLIDIPAASNPSTVERNTA